MKRIANLLKHLYHRGILSRTVSLLLAVVMLFYAIPSVIYAEAIDAISAMTEAAGQDSTDTNATAQSAPADSQSLYPTYEVTELREENVKHFHLSDGSYVAAQYNEPVHYTDENGALQDIDNSLSGNGSEFSDSRARIKFAKKINGSETLFTLHDGNTKLTLSLLGANKGAVGVVRNNEDAEGLTELEKMTNLEKLSASVLYENILDGVDLEYIAHSLNIKENIIVKERKQSYAFSFEMKLNNLTAHLTDSGDIEILTDDGEVKYVIPAPVVFDSAGEHAPVGAAYYTLEGNNKKYTLTVTVSAEWMNSADRAFPVTVDPAITNSYQSIIDTSISSDAPDASLGSLTNLIVSSLGIAFWKTQQLPSVPNSSYIKRATITLRSLNLCYYDYVGAYTVTSNWTEDLTYYEHLLSDELGGTISDTVLDYQVLNSSGFYDWNITDLVREWYEDESTNFGVAFKAITVGNHTPSVIFASSEYTNADYSPTLTVHYQSMKGVEDYWSYSSHSAGVAGSGSINLANGQLTLAIPTLTTTDSLFGFTPTLIYDSALAGKSYVYPNAETANTVDFMPRGFKLNMTETLLKKSFEVDANTICPYYVYADADGTEHGFYYTGEEGKYLDEDGLGMMLTEESDGTILISNDTNYVKTFVPNTLFNSSDSNVLEAYYLIRTQDSYGSELVFSYTSALKPYKVSIKPAGFPIIDFLQFSYNNAGKLKMIYNPTSKDAVIFRYSSTYSGDISANASAYLKQIDYAHGNDSVTSANWSSFYSDQANTTNITVNATANYEYNSDGSLISVIDNLLGQKISYTLISGNHTSVRQFSGTELGSSLEYFYYTGYTDVKSWGADATIYTDDDVYTRHTFDDFGRSTSVYSYANIGTEIYGATVGKYSENERAKNSIEHQMVIGGTSVNYLLNGDFSEYSSPSVIPFSYWQESGNIVKTTYSNSYYTETQSIFDGVTCYPEFNEPTTLAQQVSLNPGEYTLSIPYYAENAENVTGFVEIKTIGSSDLDITRYFPLNFDGVDRVVSTLSETFTVSGDESSKVEIKITFSTDTEVSAEQVPDIKLAKLSLINSSGGYNYSYVKYGSFEESVLYYNNEATVGRSLFWERNSYLNSSYVYDSAERGYSVKITGDIEQELFMTQTVIETPEEVLALYGTEDFPGNTGGRYILGGFGKADSAVFTENAKFSLRADVVYYQGENDDDVIETYRFSFSPHCTDWQFVCGAFDTHRTSQEGDTVDYSCVKAIKIYCEYSNQPQGYALFDDIFLIDSTEVDHVKYLYNDEGLPEQKLTRAGRELFFYNSARKLTMYVYKDTEFTEYHYNARNLVDYKLQYTHGSDDCVKTDYVYNSFGQCTSVTSYPIGTLLEQVPSSKIMSEHYSYVTNPSSKIVGALKTSRDTNNITKTYFYNEDNGRLLAEVNTAAHEGYCYSYDTMGNLVCVMPATTSSGEYSAVNNAEKVEYLYNDKNLLSKIMTQSTTYTFLYDAFGNRTLTAAGNTILANNVYNQHNGKLEKTSYINGVTVNYEYNKLDLVSKIWYTVSGAQELAYEYEYTSDGKLYKFINHKSGKTTVYHYDNRRLPIYVEEYDNTTLESEFNANYRYNAEGIVAKKDYLLNYQRGEDFGIAGLVYIYSYNSRYAPTQTVIGNQNTNATVSYTYDDFDRLSRVNYNYRGSSQSQGTFSYSATLTYKSDSTKTYNQVERYLIQAPYFNNSLFIYTYDEKGNIASIEDSAGWTVHYTYDDLGQLIREDNRHLGRTYVYEYDNAGNIIKSTEYSYTRSENISLTPIDEHIYGYENSVWGDMLTSFDGVNLAYDKSGNPRNYYNGNRYIFVWEERNLRQVLYNSFLYTYTYDSNGLRRSMTTDGLTIDYYYDGTSLVSEKWSNGDIFLYVYDVNGAPIGMQYRKSTYEEDVWDVYWYVKNMQGDIIAIYDDDGTRLVRYIYDAWGNFQTIYENGGNNTTAVKNPFTYRGYYYDVILGLYYLQSRYYDPIVKRFISPDCFVSTGQGLVGYNMFAYCNNNPVMYVDPTGDFPWLVIIILVACTAIGATMGATSDEKLFENPNKTFSNANPSTNELGENQELSNGEFDEKQELTVSDRVANAFIGGALGLAAGGAIVATGGGAVSLVVGSATEYVTLIGMSGAQAFAIGSLSYNILPMIVAPFFGIESEPIELP